jgi:hypothetical protein
MGRDDAVSDPTARHRPPTERRPGRGRDDGKVPHRSRTGTSHSPSREGTPSSTTGRTPTPGSSPTTRSRSRDRRDPSEEMDIGTAESVTNESPRVAVRSRTSEPPERTDRMPEGPADPAGSSWIQQVGGSSIVSGFVVAMCSSTAVVPGVAPNRRRRSFLDLGNSDETALDIGCTRGFFTAKLATRGCR